MIAEKLPELVKNMTPQIQEKKCISNRIVKESNVVSLQGKNEQQRQTMLKAARINKRHIQRNDKLTANFSVPKTEAKRQ